MGALQFTNTAADIIFQGFGIYFLIITFFPIRKWGLSLYQFDYLAIKIVLYSGIIITVCGISLILIQYGLTRLEYFAQLLLWFFFTQPLWLKNVRKSFIVRLLISLILLLPIRLLIAIAVIFNRDYIIGPSSMVYLLSDIPAKGVFFLLTVFGIQFICRKMIFRHGSRASP